MKSSPRLFKRIELPYKTLWTGSLYRIDGTGVSKWDFKKNIIFKNLFLTGE